MRHLSVLVCLALVACSIESTGSRTPFEPPKPDAPYLPELGPGDRRVVILHTNDEHSHLLGYGPSSQYPYLPVFDSAGEVDLAATLLRTQAKLTTGDSETVGGLVRRQFLINRERAHAAESGDSVLLVSAGDVMMGTLLHATYAAGQAPDYLAMTLLGYDFISLGNHEFDFGPDQLAGAINVAHQLTFGGATPILSANLFFEDVNAGGAGFALEQLTGDGDSGAPIMPWATKLLSNGLRVGVFGLVGYDAAFVAPAKTPVAFSRPGGGSPCVNNDGCDEGLSCVRRRCTDPADVDGHLGALAADAQAAIDELLAEEVDLVIGLTHLGMAEDTYLASNTVGIDVIVGGHSHDEIAPTTVGDTVIVQAGQYGEKLGKLSVVVDPDGNVSVETDQAVLIPVDTTVDAALRLDSDAVATATTMTAGVLGALVGGINDALLEALVGDVLGVTTDDINASLAGITSDHDVRGGRGETYLGHLATDAMLQQVWTKQWGSSSVPMIAVEANGVLRESLRFEPPRGLSGSECSLGCRTTLADVFRVLPLGGSPWEGPDTAAPGYPTVIISLTPVELLAALEVGVTRGLESDAFFLNFSGMRIEYDRNRPDLVGNTSTGHVVTVEVEEQPLTGNWFTLYDANAAEPWKDAGGSAIDDPTAVDDRVMVVTNLYIAGFLATYGLPARGYDGEVLGDPETDSLTEQLSHAAVCHQPLVPFQTLVMCENIPPIIGEPPWLLPELKGWEALLMFLNEEGFGDQDYLGVSVAVADQRIQDVTP